MLHWLMSLACQLAKEWGPNSIHRHMLHAFKCIKSTSTVCHTGQIRAWHKCVPVLHAEQNYWAVSAGCDTEHDICIKGEYACAALHQCMQAGRGEIAKQLQASVPYKGCLRWNAKGIKVTQTCSMIAAIINTAVACSNIKDNQ